MNDTDSPPWAAPNPDSAPPRTYTGRTGWSAPVPQNIPGPRTEAGDTFRDYVERERAARNLRRWDLAVGLGLCPSRLHEGPLVFDGKVVHGGCVIIDDPIDPGSERYQQARRGVPYPRGTRAQRRRTATARVQRARKTNRTVRKLLARWVGADLQARIHKTHQEMATFSDKLAWDGVPAGPYDPPPSLNHFVVGPVGVPYV